MARPVRPGSIQSTLAACYAAAGGTEAVAADLGLAASTVSYGTELSDSRPGGLGLNHVDRLARMHPAVAARLAQHYAPLGGGAFVPGSDRAGVRTVLHHASELMREVGEGSAALVSLHEGGCRDVARRELQDIIDVAVAAMAALDRTR